MALEMSSLLSLCQTCEVLTCQSVVITDDGVDKCREDRALRICLECDTGLHEESTNTKSEIIVICKTHLRAYPGATLYSVECRTY